MVVALQERQPAVDVNVNQLPKNQLILVHVTLLSPSNNCRWGWDRDNILDAYRPAILELKETILSQGFLMDKAITAYPDPDGGNFLIVKDGNRRTLASQLIWDEDQLMEIVPNQDPGMVWVIILESPASQTRLMLEQTFQNRSLPNTPLDIAKAYSERVKEIQSAFGCKETEAIEKLIEELPGNADGKKPSVSTIRTNYLRLLDNPEDVLNWLQESHLEVATAKISYTMVKDIKKAYGNEAHKGGLLLAEAYKLYKKGLIPKEMIAPNTGHIKLEFFNALAVDLDIPLLSDTPKKNRTTRETPAATPAQNTAASTVVSHSNNNNDDDDDADETTTATTTTSVVPQSPEPPSEPSARRKASKDHYLTQIVKALIKTPLAQILATCMVEVIPDGETVRNSVQLNFNQEEIRYFNEFQTNLSAYLGDPSASEAIEKQQQEVAAANDDDTII